MKLCIFPNDPIISYFEKGELKERYYNPKNLFDEIDIISFIDREIDESKVRILFGDAKYKIHTFGKLNLFNKTSKKSKVLSLLKKSKPDIIRSYNAMLEGWIAAYCSKKLNVPLFVSLHVQYDAKRELAKTQNYKKYLALRYYKKNIEPFTLNAADKITIVYKIIEPYVTKLCDKTPEILYNRVDLKRFREANKTKQNVKPQIITVGRLTPRKNHDCLIKAVIDLDVNVLIIGDGESYNDLKNLVEKLNLQNKIMFKKRVAHNEIQNYYKNADMFVQVYNPEIEGLPMPVIEAMASGLPVIVSNPISGLSDGLDDSVEYSEVEPDILAEKIGKIISNTEYATTLSKRSLIKSQDFDGEKIEKREAEIYGELLK